MVGGDIFNSQASSTNQRAIDTSDVGAELLGSHNFSTLNSSEIMPSASFACERMGAKSLGEELAELDGDADGDGEGAGRVREAGLDSRWVGWAVKSPELACYSSDALYLA